MASGDRTNPWQQEAGSRRIRPGDLVGFDTDMVGPFGYFADISRTFFCGPGKPSDHQKELYQRAYEEITFNMELMQPGMGFREVTEKAFRQPERFRRQHYPALAHGCRHVRRVAGDLSTPRTSASSSTACSSPAW